MNMKIFFNLLTILTVLISSNSALAQTLTQGPQFHLATCTGANTVMVCRVPVFTTTGTTTSIYWWDVTYNFFSNNAGDLFTASSPVLTKAPDVPGTGGTGGGGTSGGNTGGGGGTFRSGCYLQTPPPSSARENKAILCVTGPGPNSVWVANAAPDASCGFPQSAIWYAGVPTSSHPLGARLTAANITGNAFSYGSGGGLDTGVCIGAPNGFRQWWRTNSVIGVTQVNSETLVFVSFTNSDNRNKPDVPDEWEDDQATPGGTVTYKYVGPLPPTTP